MATKPPPNATPPTSTTRRRVVGASLGEDDDRIVDELRALMGTRNESELLRLGLRALLREQRLLAGPRSLAPHVEPGSRP